MYILCILIVIKALTEKEVSQIMNSNLERIGTLNQYIQNIIDSIPAKKLIRKKFFTMPKDVYMSKNLFARHLDTFEASGSGINEYYTTYECFLGFLPYLINLITMSNVIEEKKVLAINVKAFTTHMKDKTILQNYIAEIYSNIEKYKRLGSLFRESLQKIRVLFINFDHLYRTMENSIIVDLCTLKSMIDRHSCAYCVTLSSFNSKFHEIKPVKATISKP